MWEWCLQLKIENSSAFVWSCSLFGKEVVGRARHGFSWNWQQHGLHCGSLFCGLLSWCRKTDLLREERKQMLSPSSGKKDWMCWCVTDKRSLVISFKALWLTAFNCSGACLGLHEECCDDNSYWPFCFILFVLHSWWARAFELLSFSYPPPLPLTVVNLCS